MIDAAAISEDHIGATYDLVNPEAYTSMTTSRPTPRGVRHLCVPGGEIPHEICQQADLETSLSVSDGTRQMSDVSGQDSVVELGDAEGI